MKILSRGLLLALAATLTLMAGVSTAAADRRVKIVNNTSVTIERFYASLTNSQKWGQDRLVTKVIPSGYSATIDFNRDPKGCFFDFRAEFVDGDVLEKFGINVCEIGTFTYHE